MPRELPSTLFSAACFLWLRGEFSGSLPLAGRSRWGAAFLMAFHPSAIGLSADVTRDTLYLFTGGSAVLFALYGIRSGKWQGWCFSALFLAFGLFVRYEILELVPLTVACFLIAPAVRSISLKTALANFAVWGGTFLISALAIALLTGVLPQTAAAYNERIQRISIQKI